MPGIKQKPGWVSGTRRDPGFKAYAPQGLQRIGGGFVPKQQHERPAHAQDGDINEGLQTQAESVVEDFAALESNQGCNPDCPSRDELSVVPVSSHGADSKEADTEASKAEECTIAAEAEPGLPTSAEVPRIVSPFVTMSQAGLPGQSSAVPVPAALEGCLVVAAAETDSDATVCEEAIHCSVDMQVLRASGKTGSQLSTAQGTKQPHVASSVLAEAGSAVGKVSRNKVKAMQDAPASHGCGCTVM